MKKIFSLIIPFLITHIAVLAQATANQPAVPTAVRLVQKKHTVSTLITSANAAAQAAECGPCILNVNSRAQYNQPGLYSAKCEIKILPGFVSVINDVFITHIDNTLLPCDSAGGIANFGKSSDKSIKNYQPKTTDVIAADKPLVIYPNPANNIVYVEINSVAKDDVIISVLDISGKKIQKLRRTITGRTVLSINIVNYATGMYTILVYGKKISAVQKFIKQ